MVSYLIKLAAVGSLGLAMLFMTEARAAETFETPEAAVEALLEAVQSDNGTRLVQIFGEGSEDLASTGVEEVDQRNWQEFVDAYEDASRIVVGDGTAELFVGREQWPFPVLLVKGDAGWTFDTDSARDEILYRRIGRNELNAIDVAKTFIRAQYEYYVTDHDDDGVLEFAQYFLSAPGEEDGLYYPTEPGEQESPLGPLIAVASEAGYAYAEDGRTNEPEPYSGYYFRVLTSQSEDAPGGAFDYVINGNMVAGFGMLAIPANYGVSGVMTFMLGRNGEIYQRDLGTATLDIATEIDSFDPGLGWSVLEE